MKVLGVLAIGFMAFSFSPNESVADNACTDCTERLMKQLAACKDAGGTNCDAVYSKAWTDQCQPLCTK